MNLRTSGSALAFLAFALIGVSGCDQNAKVQDKETVSSPEGTTTTTTTKEIKSSGSNPPTNSAGERVEPNK